MLVFVIGVVAISSSIRRIIILLYRGLDLITCCWSKTLTLTLSSKFGPYRFWNVEEIIKVVERFTFEQL